MLERGLLHASLSDPAMESMNLLNQVAERYPKAVSLAAGRPFEGFYDLEDMNRYLNVFCSYLTRERGLSERDVLRILYQYGPTKGVIGELIARHLAVDEAIEAQPAAVVVTVGAQEAMYLVLRALRAGPQDAVLAVDPTYVGLTGAALLAEMPVLPVPVAEDGIDLDALVVTLRRARAAGRRVRACYLIPDFANPIGLSMSADNRVRLLEVARSEDLLLIEDNAYGVFHPGAERPRTLRSLDRDGRVIYIGSFAKTGVAGARVGFVVADQPVAAAAGPGGLLADELGKLKSMLTVNTSPIAQAVIGGKLIAHDFSLVAANRRERAVYAANLQAVLTGLDRRLGGLDGVGWNRPEGGFFVVLTVPFEVDDALLEQAAEEFGVLFTPMRHFHSTPAGDRQLRLSISNLTPEVIDEGLDRLAALIRHRLA
ncbi:MAG TPA: PLP-dependent aminotransferase family protein [Trebonia sp.]|nr:PLP-dependent aminotransferase family protein [Trebonia sp.]